MQKISHTIRVNAEDLKRWKVAAAGSGIKTLSEWMRRALNEACDGKVPRETSKAGNAKKVLG